MTSATSERKIVQFLSEHFNALELMHLARGILDAEAQLLVTLPPINHAPLDEWVSEFVSLLRRHGFLDNEFFKALAAARPRLKHQVVQLKRSQVKQDLPQRTDRGSSRLRLHLEMDIDSLPEEKLKTLLELFRSTSGGAVIRIESISEGSVVLILRGETGAIERLYKFLSHHTEIEGIPIFGVERVLDEEFSETPIGDGHTRHGSALVLDSLNLNAAERLLCIEALNRAGNIVDAAQLLGITRHALKRRIIKHRIRWPRRPDAARLTSGRSVESVS